MKTYRAPPSTRPINIKMRCDGAARIAATRRNQPGRNGGAIRRRDNAGRVGSVGWPFCGFLQGHSVGMKFKGGRFSLSHSPGKVAMANTSGMSKRLVAAHAAVFMPL